jgi:hypothetical protein
MLNLILQQNSNAEVVKWTKVVDKWTRWLVVVGFLSALAVSFQLLAFVESERAKLAISGARILDETASPITIIIEITNSGRATAKRGQVSYYSRRQSLPSIQDYNNPTTMFFAPVVPGGVLRQAVGCALDSVGGDANAILRLRRHAVFRCLYLPVRLKRGGFLPPLPGRSETVRDLLSCRLFVCGLNHCGRGL